MSRTLPYLAELQPAMFVEVSPELATERGLRHLDWAHVVTARAVIEARVLVTERLTPLRVEDQRVHQIWLPYHWGGEGLSTGDSANDLLGITLDPNVLIQEGKVGTCDVRPGNDRPARQETGGESTDTWWVPTACPVHWTPPPTQATPTRHRGWASSPTPASASAARLARSPARSGTGSQRTT
jgi:formate dehydrogenase major subunit